MARRRALLISPLPCLFILYIALLWRRNALAFLEIDQITNGTEKKRIEGCIECGDYRCPGDLGKCLLGSVPDPCECCTRGLCARLDGEPCWNSSIPGLSLRTRNDGPCASNSVCKLQTDEVQEEDEPRAICVCMEQSPVCGSDNKTYATPCALHEEAMRRRNSSSLRFLHLGPCETRPWIVSPLENVLSVFGQQLALNCEAAGFPVPDIVWKFRAANERKVLRLPGDVLQATVHSSIGPEPFRRISWMQLARVTKEHIGMYHCIANNSFGQASSVSFVSIL